MSNKNETINFSEWDAMYKTEDLKKSVKKAAENEFKDVAEGVYIVKLDKLELGKTGPQSKKPGSPMAKVVLKIQEGEFKKQNIFLNFMLIPNDQGQNFGLHRCNEFLRSLDSGLDIEFNGFADYNELLMDIKEEVDKQKLSFEIDYKLKNGFGNVTVTDVFED